jgi:virginiamycin B lyase
MVEGLEDRALLSGALTRFPAPESNGVVGPLVAGPDGNVWFLETVYTSTTTSNSVDRITPDGRISTVAPILGDTFITDLTNGPDGNEWYAGSRTLDQKTNATEAVVGRVSPSGDVAEFIVPNANDASHITSGRDGNLWFTAGSFVGRVTPSGQITEFTLPTFASTTAGIAADSQGNLWVAGDQGPIFRVTTSGQVNTYSLPKFRVTASQGFKEPPIILAMTTGPDGNVWFTETSPSGVMHVTPSGQLSRFTALPLRVNGYVGPVTYEADQITAAPGRKLFFSVVGSVLGYPGPKGPLDNRIGEITTSGRVSFIRVPTNVNPSSPLVAPDGNLWFVDGNRIDRLTLPQSHRRGAG